MRNHIQPLEQALDLKLVGGKALSLGNLLRGGFAVPAGFVITTEAFGKMDRTLAVEIIDNFDRLGSSFVAVRSSAVSEDGQDTAWAGQLDTFLNVGRRELVQDVTRCWQSASSDRAISYAAQHNIEAGKIAVIVQAMIPAESAGVAFSVHPITQNSDEIVIEAAFGLGEAVVSGEVTPDNYIVNKYSNEISQKFLSRQAKQLTQSDSGKSVWQIVEPKSSEQQKLPDSKIRELAELVARLEKLYGYPVDVEWALFKNQIFLLQCRPITALE